MSRRSGPAARARADLEACEKLCVDLKKKIAEIKGASSENLLSDTAGKDVTINRYEPQHRNLCTGHFGKIYALHWGPDSKHIVTASQDGKLIIWNAITANKQLAITLSSAWVMTCAFAPSFDYIASGGLDNTVSIFSTTIRGDQGGKFRDKTLKAELEKHDGYLSCARFINDTRLISASGDGTCILWDIENQQPLSMFMDHTGDVMSIALKPSDDESLFVSGSVDMTAKVWDYRAGEKSVANFSGHKADINTVQWFPDGQCVATGSDDGTVRLFDMRSYRQLNKYLQTENHSQHASEPAGVTSIDVSKTGQYIFSAYDNGHVYMWSTLASVVLTELEHPSRVSSLGVSDDGYALATGCWDFNLRTFA
jgi:guanine nucleotide-binding protein G(I)/G(S)/G(T) subunit beta-1